jgi:hypothetical protein
MIVIAVIIVATSICIRIRNVKIVRKHSVRLQELRSLNQRTVFYGGEYKEFKYHQECRSKRQYDNLQLEEYLIALLDENRGDFATRLSEIDYNRKNYATYLREADLILPTVQAEECAQWKMPKWMFLWLENRLFKKALLKKPLTEIAVICVASYTSPQGRNSYKKEHVYNYTELKYYFECLAELKEMRRTRQYQIKVERAKMTDSLRWDILKRDNYRCQVCGSTAQDGVKLHVDHIIPVSKGGLTIKSNLQTLCDRCNFGKRDKM